MSARILIVDDHDVVRQGIRTTMSRARPEWEVCGEAANGKEAIEAVAALRPDVVILDITMPVMSGLEAAPCIARLDPNCRVLIFTMHESQRLVADIRASGAHGYVQKSQAGRDLILAIDCLLAGGTFFGAQDGAGPKEEKKPKPGISFRTAFCLA